MLRMLFSMQELFIWFRNIFVLRKKISLNVLESKRFQFEKEQSYVANFEEKLFQIKIFYQPNLFKNSENNSGNCVFELVLQCVK